MELIVLLKGRVKYPLTLDSGVWIFDDRKVDLTTYFDKQQVEIDALEAYTKSVSEHWDRELKEGSTIALPSKKVVKKFEKEKLLTGTFAIPFRYFLENAEPEKDVSQVTFKTSYGEKVIPYKEAYNGLFAFSLNGKALIDGGPMHFVNGDGSNLDSPIKSIKEIVIT